MISIKVYLFSRITLLDVHDTDLKNYGQQCIHVWVSERVLIIELKLPPCLKFRQWKFKRRSSLGPLVYKWLEMSLNGRNVFLLTHASYKLCRRTLTHSWLTSSKQKDSEGIIAIISGHDWIRSKSDKQYFILERYSCFV